MNCTFTRTLLGEHLCRLNEIEELNSAQDVVIVGEHLGNRTNADVEVVEIRDSNTPFMIQQIFSTFPNMLDLNIRSSKLESIDIPDSVQLIWLSLALNNISRIANGTFRGQNQLRFFDAVGSGIKQIDVDAFVGLESLSVLVLIRNNLTHLAPGTLDPLINVERIDFDQNQLKRIDDIFRANTKLKYLYIDDNQIDAVSPRFTAAFRTNQITIELSNNICIDQNFMLIEEFDLINVHNLLNSCFVNYIDDASASRYITFEFQGPLAFYDEFGNIIARVN